MMKPLILLGILIPLLLCFSCKDDEKAPEAIKITLDKSIITFDRSGGQEHVQVTSNSAWTADNIPGWITLSQVTGKDSHQISITIIEPNTDEDSRETDIKFVAGKEQAILKVIQNGKTPEKISEAKFTTLAFSTLEDISFVPGENQDERLYSFKMREMFINPALTDKIFIGNIIDPNIKEATDISVYNKYTFVPITISAGIQKVDIETIIPSREAQDRFAKAVLDNKPTQSEKLITQEGLEFYSHRALNLTGRGNMGIPLDEVVSGKSYLEQEMSKKTGLIYSFSHSLFTIVMDLQEKHVEENLHPTDFPKNNISSIPYVSYGRIGLLIVESDNDAKEVKRVINKIIRENSSELSDAETNILNNLSACHIYFDKTSKMRVIKGQKEAIESYSHQMTNDLENIYPFQFAISDFFTQGVDMVNFDLLLK